MKSTQILTDKLAIGLSLACAFHCLALPIVLALLPSLTILHLDNEAFHFWMIVVVVPSSIYALTLGCKRHGRYNILFIGSVGLLCLVLAVALGEENITQTGEKVLTLLGASFVAVGHWFNYRLCRTKSKQNNTCCSNE